MGLRTRWAKWSGRRKVFVVGLAGMLFVCFGCVILAVLLPKPEPTSASPALAEASTLAPKATRPQAPTQTPAPTETPTPTGTPTPTETPAPTDTPAPTNTPEPIDTPAPTDTLAPTNTPAPTATVTNSPAPTATPPIEVQVGQLAEAILGTSNRGVPRLSEISVYELYDGTVRIEIRIALNDNLTVDMVRWGAYRDVLEVSEGLYKAGFTEYEFYFFGYLALVDVYGNSSEATVLKASLSPDTLARINWENILIEDFPRIADTFDLHHALDE
jgi:hypothetical protein